MHGWGWREEAQHHHGSSEERVRKKEKTTKEEGGGREGGSRSEHERDLERRTESQQTDEGRRGVPSSSAGSGLRVVVAVVVRGVSMSSPCLLRAAPMSQPRLREVKISLKAGGRETTAIHRSIGGGTKEAVGRPHAQVEKETAARVGVGGSRSRSTPPVHRAQRPEKKKTERGSSSSRHQEPQHHPERNGTLLQVPLTMVPVGHLSSSSSSSSSCTPRRQRPSHPRPHPHPPPEPEHEPEPHPPLAATLSSSSSSSSANSMKRARWLSYSTSNICFNSILEGRFRQLQGTG